MWYPVPISVRSPSRRRKPGCGRVGREGLWLLEHRSSGSHHRSITKRAESPESRAESQKISGSGSTLGSRLATQSRTSRCQVRDKPLLGSVDLDVSRLAPASALPSVDELTSFWRRAQPTDRAATSFWAVVPTATTAGPRRENGTWYWAGTRTFTASICTRPSCRMTLATCAGVTALRGRGRSKPWAASAMRRASLSERRSATGTASLRP